MSLDWSIGKCANHKELWVEAGKDSDGEQLYRLNQVTDALIWATMSVGLWEIKEDNIKKWMERLHVLNIVDGGHWGDLAKLEVLERHIGLTTNAFPNKTDAKFYNGIKKGLQRDGKQYAERNAKAG